MNEKLLTLKDLATRWGVNVDTATKIVRSGSVPFLTLGPPRSLTTPGPKNYRFRFEDIEAWEAGELRQFKPAAKKRRSVSMRAGVDADIATMFD